MNRAEFMRRLTELLGDVPPTERDEAIQYYNDYFDDAGTENESGVIASLGSPEELARTIKAGLSDGGNGGEFTESGFSGYTRTQREELIRAEEAGNQGGTGQDNRDCDAKRYGSADGKYGSADTGAGQAGAMGAGGSAGAGGQAGSAYYNGAYYRRPEGDGVYGGREDKRRYDNPYEQGAAGSSGSTAQKEGMSGSTIALVVILAILTSPIWIGLAGGLFGIAVGLLATIFGIFLAFLIAGVAFIVVAIALIVVGFSLLFSLPLGGVCMIGTALILFAVGLVCIWLMVLMAGMAIPAFVRGCASLCRKLFKRGGVRA